MTVAHYWPRTRTRQALLVLVVLLVAAPFVATLLLEEPLRRHVEAGVNASLKGYKVQIARLDLHLLGLSLELENTTVVQEENPSPPMAELPSLTASVHWGSIFYGRLVADFQFDGPKLFVDTRQGKKELADTTPVSERGWQQAAYEIYPLKINELKIENGSLTYTPEGDFEPLELTNVNAVASNIRNIRSRDREYPSHLHLDAVAFEHASLAIDGDADFFSEPHPGIRTNIDLSKLPLSYFTGLIHEYATIRKGTLSGTGVVEYAPKIKELSLETVSITGADADIVKTAGNEARAEEVKQKTIREAKKVSNDPGIVLRAKDVRMTGSTLGWIDRTGNPDYRIFASALDVSVKGFSNQKSEGAGVIDAKGMLNGTGPSTFHVVFKPETKSPDFDLAVKVNDVDLRSLNDLLRAKANIDVTKGKLGYFSELNVRNNYVDGYVKVLFSDVDVYDSVQDKDKPLVRKAYEAVADGVANLLENRKTDDTATKASISGPIENPDASIVEIFGRLVQNAFFKAILPGLDHEVVKVGSGHILTEQQRALAESGKEREKDGEPKRKSLFGNRDDDEDDKQAKQPKAGEDANEDRENGDVEPKRRSLFGDRDDDDEPKEADRRKVDDEARKKS